MRRLAFLIVLPFLVAGCSDGSAAAGGATPAAGASAAAGGATASVDPSVAAVGDKALSGNTKAICDQATRTSTTFGETFIADLKLQIESQSKSASDKAEAKEKIQRDVENYSVALSQMAELADDKALKAALTTMSKSVQALKGDVQKLNADKMSDITANLDKACGKS